MVLLSNMPEGTQLERHEMGCSHVISKNCAELSYKYTDDQCVGKYLAADTGVPAPCHAS